MEKISILAEKKHDIYKTSVPLASLRIALVLHMLKGAIVVMLEVDEQLYRGYFEMARGKPPWW